jgi:Tfp pilus assembly protein PilE
LIIKPLFTLISTNNQHLSNKTNTTLFKMKVSAIICTLMAAVAVTASAAPNIQARDTCGAGFGGDQRRTNSPCQASNGDRHFCGCDRTGVVCLHSSPDCSSV